MKMFNRQGMMLFPNPIKKTEICKNKNLLVVKECYCHNGHDLISEQAIFNGFNGILVKVQKGDITGHVALSPVYGYKSRVSMDVKLMDGEKWEVFCPTCNEPLPIFSSCECDGDLVCLFLDNEGDYSNCILICNRIDCFNAEMKFKNQLLHYSSVDALI